MRVKERVPDEIVAQADQIVNIDLPAEDLQERLNAGKIYPKERIEAALANFFTQKNLTRLREMTLAETANFLDRQQRETGESDRRVSALGQVMVAISSLGPDPGRLLRKTARLGRAAQCAMVCRLRPNAKGIRRPHRRDRPTAYRRHLGNGTKDGRSGHFAQT